MDIKVVEATEAYNRPADRPCYWVYKSEHYAEFERGERVKTGPMNAPRLLTVAFIETDQAGGGVYMQTTAGMGAGRSGYFKSYEAAVAKLERI